MPRVELLKDVVARWSVNEVDDYDDDDHECDGECDHDCNCDECRWCSCCEGRWIDCTCDHNPDEWCSE